MVRETNGQFYADSRDIARALEIQHKTLLETVGENLPLIEQEFGRVAFHTATLQTRGGPQKTRIALLTEDQALFTATLSRNSAVVMRFKAALVKAFDNARRALQQSPAEWTLPEPTSKNYLEALKRIVETQERLVAVEEEHERVKQEIVASVLDVRAYQDFLASEENEYSWAAAAKMFDGDGQPMGRTRLLAILREQRVLINGGINHNTPYQKYVNAGYFRLLVNPDRPERPTTVVTPKGLSFLSRKLAEIREQTVVPAATGRIHDHLASPTVGKKD